MLGLSTSRFLVVEKTGGRCLVKENKRKCLYTLKRNVIPVKVLYVKKTVLIKGITEGFLKLV